MCLGFVFCSIAAILTLCELDNASLDRDFSQDLPRVPPTDAADALANIQVLPGFRVELVAAEPLIRDPIAMDFDEQGRLYVVEMPGYSEQREEERGTIKRLTDTDGDGVFDSATIYADDLPWATAVACWDGGIFVGVAPDILYCKDSDDDGVADSRDVVYTGFGLSNVQGLLNSFQWGLDNRIHGATSSSGAEVTRPDDPSFAPLSLRGRDFSFDPRTRDIRAESGGAQYGLSLDAWGNKFLCSNSDHCQTTVFEDRYIARNPYYAAPGARINIADDGPAAPVYRISPDEPWRVLRTRLRVQGLVPGPIEGGGTPSGYFTSATGITAYEGDGFPEAMRGNLFIAEPAGNLVHRKVLEPDGVTFTARRADENTEFVRSTDNWFRPVQLANGPDGALYIADMYREIVEHPESLPPVIKQHLDLTSGNDRGRIYRVLPKNFSPSDLSDLSDLSSEALVPLLDHPNAWHRRTAARLLHARQDAAAVPALKQLAREGSALGRLHALYALAGMDALDEETLVAALADRDPGIRRHTLRLAEAHAEAPEIQQAMLRLAEDDDARVRYQAAFSLGGIEGADRNAALAQLAASDGDDNWFRVALLSSLYQGAAEVLQLALESGEVSDDLLQSIAVQAGASGDAQSIDAVLAKLDSLASGDATQRVARGLVDGLRQSGRGGVVRDAILQHDTTATLVADLVAGATMAAHSEALDPDKRAEAVRTLAFAEYDAAAPLLNPLLSQATPLPVQLAALNTLGAWDRPEVAGTILDQWPSLGPEARTQATEVLFARESRVSALLDAVKAGEVAPSSIESTRVQMLREYPDEALREQALALFPAEPVGRRGEVVDAHRVALDLEGDTARGRELFIANCAQCHHVEGQGYHLGPDLATVANSGAEKILMNILDPNREVNPQYINYVVETNDWEMHSGVITSETATSITLQRANGVEETILRVNIESIRSTEMSIMPEGWEVGLKDQDLADLITYLLSFK
jgi:putative membrane-bound dehydrogenase-like protein